MPKIYLWDDESVKTAVDRPSITPMLCDDGKIHPAVLVIPGGGYLFRFLDRVNRGHVTREVIYFTRSMKK